MTATAPPTISCKIKENRKGKIIKIIYSNKEIDKYQYNKFSQLIYFKSSNGNEQWWKYDENNNKIDITEQIKNKKIEKEFISREPINPFSLLDI